MSKYNIVCNETHYDSDRDALVTSGSMTFNGEPATFEYEEKDGRYYLSVQSKDFEIYGHNKNFPSISGEGLSHPAVQEFLKNPEEVHQAIEQVTSEYQDNNHDARIARLNYAAPEIEDYGINAHNIERNEGDVGEFYGKLRIESEAFRFTADRDGGVTTITQIALVGEPMEDPRTFGLSDDLMERVTAEADRAIDDFERQEAIDKALGGTEHDTNDRSGDEPEL